MVWVTAGTKWSRFPRTSLVLAPEVLQPCKPLISRRTGTFSHLDLQQGICFIGSEEGEPLHWMEVRAGWAEVMARRSLVPESGQ